jgi:hypothetical protein
MRLRRCCGGRGMVIVVLGATPAVRGHRAQVFGGAAAVRGDHRPHEQDDRPGM